MGAMSCRDLPISPTGKTPRSLRMSVESANRADSVTRPDRTKSI